MGRPPRITEPGVAYHLLNRRVMRPVVFEKWVSDVNRPMDDEAWELVRQSATRGMPLETDGWKTRIAARLGLDITLRPRGRRRKQHEETEKPS